MNEIKELIKEKLQHHSLLSITEISKLMNVLSFINLLEEEKLTQKQIEEIGNRMYKKFQSGQEIK